MHEPSLAVRGHRRRQLPGLLYCSTDDMSSVALSGVRVFHSSPAASSLDYIGGPAILLGLISLATDDHTMYAAMKVLHSVLTSNAMCDYLMQHIRGYQVVPPSRLTLPLPKEVSSPG